MISLWTPKQLDVLAASLEQIDRQVESPIERQFGVAAAAELCRSDFSIVPQFVLDRYRYDFAITVPRVEWTVALIECDGAQFHSTARQLSNDRDKDAAALARSIIILRYTGTAIVRDPHGCARDALDLAKRRWEGWLRVGARA